MVVHGKLWGKKRFTFKPPFDVPVNAHSHRVMALGHIEEGVRGRGATLEPKRTRYVVAISTDMWHPYSIGMWPPPEH
jgi:hypothetical protein